MGEGIKKHSLKNHIILCIFEEMGYNIYMQCYYGNPSVNITTIIMNVIHMNVVKGMLNVVDMNIVIS